MNSADVWVLSLDRLRQVADGDASRLVLATYLKTPPEQIELTTGEHGKPALASAQLHFNCSDSGGLIVVAVSPDCELGVDVERIVERPVDRLAARAFSPEQAAAIAKLPEPERSAAFYRDWTVKEAQAKATGRGLSADSSSDQGWDVQRLTVADGYAATLVSRGPAAVRMIQIDESTAAIAEALRAGG